MVTGGSRGIGRAIALDLAKDGCNVAICARDRDAIRATEEEIKTYGVKTLGLECDVLNEEDIDKTIRTIEGIRP